MIYKNLINEIINEVSNGFIGKRDIIEDCVLGICAGLHILIDDISGVGKTTLVKSIAKATGLKLGRIQFTPDLLPGDITGMSIWDPVKRDFIFKTGSIFNEFVLADEINRASPRTQAALLEAMEENKVTIDGKTITLPAPFTVVATKNPSYYLGTFELPESQLDRFGIHVKPGYPTDIFEKEILYKYKNSNPLDKIRSVSNNKTILEIIGAVQSVEISDNILSYIVKIGKQTRSNSDIKVGLSTRGLQHLIKMAQSKALYSSLPHQKWTPSTIRL